MGFVRPFNIQTELRDGVVRIALCGELDMTTVPTLERHLAESEGDGAMEIVLDLSDLTFMDSTAVHAFLAAHHRAKTRGQKLTLVRPSRFARRVFELTGTQFLLGGE